MMGYPYGTGMMGGGGWLGVGLMLFFGALVFAGIVLLVIYLIRNASGQHGTAGTPQHPAAPGHDEAVATARRRFASGEITKEQYDELIRALG